MSKIINTLRLSRLLSDFRDVFRRVSDPRNPQAPDFSYPLDDVLMAGLAMMIVQDPSMLEFQRRLHDRRRGHNLRTIFGVDQVPEKTQLRRSLDPVAPDEIQQAFRPGLHRLQKTRLWSGFRVLSGRYAVLFDGFEFFRSTKKGCSHCLEFHHRDGRVEYAHQVVAATLAHPGEKRPIPLLLEEVRREDGQKKQDCEFNAARRMIPKLLREHRHLDLILVGDGLFSKVPMIESIQSEGGSYIIVAKPSDHKTLEENLAGLRACDGVYSWEFTADEGTHHRYEWAHEVELTAGSALKTNWFSYHATRRGKTQYRNSWVTDIRPSRETIQELVEVGRHRWQIENQAFNVLKNHGHHLEHNFGHGKEHLAFNFVILNFLAYMVHQLISLSDRLFQAVMEKIGTKYRVWDEIRVLLNHFVWGSWEALLEHMLDRRDDTGWDSG